MPGLPRGASRTAIIYIYLLYDDKKLKNLHKVNEIYHSAFFLSFTYQKTPFYALARPFLKNCPLFSFSKTGENPDEPGTGNSSRARFRAVFDLEYRFFPFQDHFRAVFDLGATVQASSSGKTEKKGRAETLPKSQRDGRRTPLSGTNPDRDHVRHPTASVVRPDFHYLATLDPCIGCNANKRRHSNFNLKFRASG